MPTSDSYDVAIVIVNLHEPEGETASRLLEIADDKGYAPGVVVAQRGEHDAGLSFRVPQDVADAFDADRGERWPLADDGAKIENEPEKASDQAASDSKAEPEAADADGDTNTPSTRKARTGKAATEE